MHKQRLGAEQPIAELLISCSQRFIRFVHSANRTHEKTPPRRRWRQHRQDALATGARRRIHFGRFHAISDPLLFAIVLWILPRRVARHPQLADAETLVWMRDAPAH